MYNKSHLSRFKKHLQQRHVELIEKSNNYRFVDEAISDLAAFKAMKLNEKLIQLSYLD